LNKKVFYHFGKFAIANDLLIIKDCYISARDKIGPPQSDTVPSLPVRDRSLPRRCEGRELFINGNGAYRWAPNSAVAIGFARADAHLTGAILPCRVH